MLLGVVVFAGVILYLTLSGTLPESDVGPVLPWLGVGFAVLSVPLAVLARVAGQKSAKQNPNMAAAERAARAAIVPAAILESAMLFNLVVWMISGSQVPNAVAAVLPFAVALAFALQSGHDG